MERAERGVLAVVLLALAPAGVASPSVGLAGVDVDAADDVFAVLFQRAEGLDRDEEARLIEVLRKWPTQEVVEALERQVASADLADNLLALRLMGELSNAETLDSLFAQIERLSPLERQYGVVRRAIESALTAVLVREPATYRVLRAQLDGLDDPLLGSTARAVGAARSGAGLPVLSGLLGAGREVDVAALDALSQLCPWDPDTLHGDPGAVIARYLGSPDAETRRQAAVSLGRVRDGRAFGELIGLLDDSDPRVRRGALWALQEISGLQFADERPKWERHHRRESSWFVEHADALAERALDGDPGVAVEALRQLSMHALFRRELTPVIAAVLSHEEQVVAVVACSALQRLGDPGAVAPLIGSLADPREPVRAAASTALESVTGERHVHAGH